jgi:hypothetical protein
MERTAQWVQTGAERPAGVAPSSWAEEQSRSISFPLDDGQPLWRGALSSAPDATSAAPSARRLSWKDIDSEESEVAGFPLLLLGVQEAHPSPPPTPPHYSAPPSAVDWLCAPPPPQLPPPPPLPPAAAEPSAPPTPGQEGSPNALALLAVAGGVTRDDVDAARTAPVFVFAAPSQEGPPVEGGTTCGSAAVPPSQPPPHAAPHALAALLQGAAEAGRRTSQPSASSAFATAARAMALSVMSLAAFSMFMHPHGRAVRGAARRGAHTRAPDQAPPSVAATAADAAALARRHARGGAGSREALLSHDTGFGWHYSGAFSAPDPDGGRLPARHLLFGEAVDPDAPVWAHLRSSPRIPKLALAGAP